VDDGAGQACAAENEIAIEDIEDRLVAGPNADDGDRVAKPEADQGSPGRRVRWRRLLIEQATDQGGCEPKRDECDGGREE